MKKLFRRLTAVFCTLALCLTSAGALSVEQALDILEDNYVGEIPAAAYQAETLDELFAIVGDPYTYYMTAEAYEAFSSSVESENSVTGIGAAIQYTADGILISSVLEGGGAKEAGLVQGDLIVAVEGESCVPAGEQHRALIIGEAGTFVTITVKHADGSVEDFRIERRSITIHNTSVTAENGVVTIDCDSFGSQTAEYFREGIEENDADAHIWVVDLRGNAGGFANAAVSTLGYFTGFGPKIYYRERGGGYFYNLHMENALTDKPVIVLVDGYSASASEILSGGIRAGSAGIVVGSRTFGKGTAQIVYDETGLPDLFDGDALKVTVYRFYCADANTTDVIGVIPTLSVDNEIAGDVAALLTAEQPKKGEYLRLHLNDSDFYIDLKTAQSAEHADAMTALLSALPPDALLVYTSDTGASKLDIAEALAQYGDASASRWFTDTADSAYRTEIDTLGTYGILGGDGAGSFFPDRTLTRAELAAMLAQAFDVTGERSGQFSDVPADSWYSGDVNAIAGLGFMGGVGGGLFDPEATLTQEQFIAVMGRLAAFLNLRAADYTDGLGDLSQFEELAPFSSWARAGAAVLTDFASANSLDGSIMLYADLSEIDPQAPVTREQAAATLCNVLKSLGVLAY